MRMPGRKTANSSKPAANPKYRSIDDILEALKDKSASNNDVEAQLDEESDQVEDEAPAKIVEEKEEIEMVTSSPVEGVDEDQMVPDKAKSSDDEDSEAKDESDSEDEEAPSDQELEEKISNNPEPVYRNVNPNPTRASDSDYPARQEVSEEENADMPPTVQKYPDYPIDEVPKHSGSEDEHTLDDLASDQPATFDRNADNESPIRRSNINQPYNNYAQGPAATYSDEPMHSRGGNPANRPFDYTIDRNTGSTKKNKMGLIFLIIFGLVVVGGAAYLLKYQFNNAKPSPSSSPTEVPSTVPTATPAPTPTVDRSKFKIRVLNGTSQSGLAATVQDKLKGLGYQGDRVGNATNAAFLRTQVRVKPNSTDLLNQLISDLAPTYDATSSTALKASDAADAEVILGTKWPASLCQSDHHLPSNLQVFVSLL